MNVLELLGSICSIAGFIATVVAPLVICIVRKQKNNEPSVGADSSSVCGDDEITNK